MKQLSAAKWIQDFRLSGLKRRNARVLQFSPEVIAQEIGFDLIERLVQLQGLDLEREPRVITTGQMIALRPCLPALTFFSARQLFEAAMQFFDLPTHVVHVLSDLRGQGLCWAIGNDPVNVAVRGDQLE